MRPPHDHLGLLACASLVLACIVACSTPDERTSRAHDDPHAPGAETSAAAAIEADDDDEPVRDGKYLYTRNCAGCHNDNGDGLGPTIVQMGLKARSFAEGHFAFGNTRESIFRTIASGVPGRSPMPGFAMVLDEDERWLIVDYVRTLMPKEEEVDESLSVMHVKDEPVIVRGMLRPIVEGAPDTPRALLVGLPEGFTFAYRADDVCLIAVYQGEFVDRRDWYDRGGSKLKVLGQLIYAVDDGDPKRSVQIEGDIDASQWRPSKFDLTRTAVHGRTAVISTAAIDETPNVLTLTVGSAWQRRLRNGPRCAPILVPIGSTSIAGSVDVSMRARAATERRLPAGMDVAMISQPHATFVEHTIVVHAKGKGLVRADDGWSIPIERNSEVTITTVLLAPGETDRIEQVLKEVLP
ncbi:MAG: c-type cytochrome [Planctomycetota bacterium]